MGFDKGPLSLLLEGFVNYHHYLHNRHHLPAELAFYGRVLGFRPAGLTDEDLPMIANCEALPKKV